MTAACTDPGTDLTLRRCSRPDRLHAQYRSLAYELVLPIHRIRLHRTPNDCSLASALPPPVRALAGAWLAVGGGSPKEVIHE